MSKDETTTPANFIRQIIDKDLAADRVSQIVTRFPPEPNGYLHIGHAKAICLNFGIAGDYDGVCYLRFDDTNPIKEESRYVEAIKDDIHWLGFQWKEIRHTSDYFETLYSRAVELIEKGLAYVDDLSMEEIREYRGKWNAPGQESPYRNRPVEENLDLFRRMRAGEFEDGSRVLRAKIDMASSNMNMRDPTLYRVRKVTHQNTGDEWCIYPMYDFAHCLSDAEEHISHSLCSLEFEDNRPLYDWVLDNSSPPSRPHQYEFARLNLEYTILSKRKLTLLVDTGKVSGWDDPRMPTISGLRRRGYTPESIRDLCDRVGVTKKDSVVEMGVLENTIREDLDHTAPRAMAVLNPLKLVITNYPEGESEELDAANHPQKPEMGSRKIPFGRELYIERDDFMEDAPKKFFRLTPGREVRLRYAYFVTCTDVIKDAHGHITEVHCTYDPATKGGGSPDGRKVKGTIHWVSAPHAVETQVRLYDRLFTTPVPGKDTGDFMDDLNPDSAVTVKAFLEPALGAAEPGSHFQFERLGYFFVDPIDSAPQRPVFNRTVTLRDSRAKGRK